MMNQRKSRRDAGVTLIELMIGIAIVAIIVTLAAPSFVSMIQVQRLRSVHSQFATDIQYARTEALRTGMPMRIRAQPAGASGGACYILYADRVTVAPYSVPCDCHQPPGSRCSAGSTDELRTVEIARSTSIDFTIVGTSDRFGWDPATGNMQLYLPDRGAVIGDPFIAELSLDTSRRLRTEVGRGGRVNNCMPSGSTVSATPC